MAGAHDCQASITIVMPLHRFQSSANSPTAHPVPRQTCTCIGLCTACTHARLPVLLSRSDTFTQGHGTLQEAEPVAAQASAPAPSSDPSASTLVEAQPPQQTPEQPEATPQPSQAESTQPSQAASSEPSQPEIGQTSQAGPSQSSQAGNGQLEAPAAAAAAPRKPALKPPARLQRKAGGLASLASHDQDDLPQAGRQPQSFDQHEHVLEGQHCYVAQDLPARLRCSVACR